MIILGEKEFDSEIEGSFSLLLFSNYYASLKILLLKLFENTTEKILALSDTEQCSELDLPDSKSEYRLAPFS